MEVGKRELTGSPAQGNSKAQPVAESSSLESAYGSVRASANPEDFDEVTRIVKSVKAAKTVKELSE